MGYTPRPTYKSPYLSKANPPGIFTELLMVDLKSLLYH